jgi:dihydroorotase
MSKLLALGVPLRDVVLMTTSNPAAVLGRAAELGTLRPGAPADVAVLAWEEGDFALRDSFGQEVRSQRRLVPRLTLKAGREAPAA